MIVKYLVFLIFTNLLCNIFTAKTPVRKQNDSEELRKKKTQCGWVSNILCGLCMSCCCNEDREKNLTESYLQSGGNISRKKPDHDLNIDRSKNGKSADAEKNIDLKSPSRNGININLKSGSETTPHGNDSVSNERRAILFQSPSRNAIDIDIESGSESKATPDRKSSSAVHLVRQSTIDSMINSIKEWVEGQPELYFPSTMDNHFIERFLIVCEKNIERTKLFIKSFFQYRFEYSEFFTDRDPSAENLQEIMDVVYSLPLRQRTEEGYQVGIVHLANTNPSKLKFIDYAKMFFNISDVRMKIEEEIPTGDIVIFDLEGGSLRHTWSLGKSYRLIRKYSTITEDAHPWAIKRIHLINVDSSMKAIIDFGLNFAQEKTKKVIISHSKGSETLFDHIAREIIPKDVGGTGPSFQQLREFWKERVQEHRDWLINNSWLNDVPKKSS